VSTANCPCCGNKEPVPAGPPGRRILCTNCGTPFVPGAEPTPPPPEPEPTPVGETAEAVPVVEVEPVEVPSPKKKPKPPSPPRRRRRERETDADMETQPEVPRHDEDDGPFVPPPSDRRRKKSGAGGALILGAAAFFLVLVCGGLGLGGYLYFRSYFDGTVAETTGKEGGTEKQPAAQETEFVEAGKSARSGDVRVSLSSAVVDVVTGTEGGAEFRSADKLLAVKVRIDNLSDGRKVEYAGWGADPGADERPRLSDDQGHAYKLVTFGGDRRAAGQLRSESIGPKKTVNDLIVFDPPGNGVEFLKLELPARNFGGSGRIGFRLPRSAIRFGAAPAEDDKSRSVPELMRALKDPDANVRRAAAAALGARGSGAALARNDLGAALKDSDASVRLAAAEALGKIGPTAHTAYPALVRALGDSDEAVRKAARESLGKIGKPFPEDVAALSAALKDPNANVRGFALETLLGMDLDVKTAAPLYAALLKDPDKRLRLEAARALAKAGPKGREAAFAALLEAQKDADPDVRKAAAEALATMGPGAANDVPALRAALKEKAVPAELRARAARSLGALGAGARDAVPDLAEALRSSDLTIRRAAAAALAQVGPDAKGAISELTQALADKDKQVRRSALEAVGKVGADGKPAADEVSDLLTDPDPETRKMARQVLAQIAPDAALTANSQALFNPDEAVRLEAAEALLAMGAAAKPRTSELIAAVRGDKSPAVRLKAAQALVVIDPTTNAPVGALADLLSGTDAKMRGEAAEALATIGGVARDAVPALNGALKDKDPAVRKNAAVALSKVGEPALPALTNLVESLSERRLHEPVLLALKNIGWVKAVPPLIKALKDQDPSVRLGAARALGQFGEDAGDAVKQLSGAMASEKDEETKKVMREALKRIKPQ
jgi:HEAT repeat protein